MTDAYSVSYQFAKAGPANLGGLQAMSPAMASNPGSVRQGYFGGGWPVPLMTAGMTFSDVGSSGLRQFGGWVREEFLPQLVGRQGPRVYREMMDNSAVVGAVMFSIIASMRRVDWRVEAANDTPAGQEAADFVEGLMDDMSHTWGDHVAESLSMLGYGFAPHEIVYKKRLGNAPGVGADGVPLPKSKFDDGKIGWRRLPLRSQDTVIKWFFGPNGEVLGLTQQPWIGPLIDLPIQKLLLYRPSTHKNNPEGRSILRSAYRSWYLSKRLEEQEAILFERLSGLPMVKVPNELLEMAAGGNPDAVAKLDSIKRIVTNVRIDEQMGIVLPSDVYPTANGGTSAPQYSFELVSPKAGQGNVDSDKAITRYNINIMTSVMADFLQLGHGARGTQALASNKVDMFFQAIEGFLNANADVTNRYGVTRLWDLNAMDQELRPNVAPDLAQRLDLDVLSNYVLRLSQAGMPLFPDLDVESYLRDAAGIPDVTDEGAYESLDILDPALSPEDQRTLAAAAANQNSKDVAPTPQRLALEKIIKTSIVRRLKRYAGHTSVSTGGKPPRKPRSRRPAARGKRARNVEAA